MEENKYICIWYSWGDVEVPVEVPKGKDAFDFMVELALIEIRVAIVECEDTATIWINEDDDGKEIVILNYHRDNEFCYYKIFENEEEADKFYDSFMEYEI